MNKFQYAFFLMLLFTTTAILSCQGDKVDVSSFLAERDSILNANKFQKQELEDMNKVLTVISSGLDSIAMQENILITNKSKDGVMLDKNQIMANIDFMAELLSRQRKRIKQLSDSLASSNNTESIKKLQNIIVFLNQQLTEKDQVIASLRADVNNKNKDINQLKSSLTTMRSNVRDLNTKVNVAEKKTEVLSEALKAQDNMINECYVKIGTKKELMNLGLVTGGFLKKKKVNYNEVNQSLFTPVDIRHFREVQLHSKKPKILTPMPNSNSFYFKDEGDGSCKLVITDPTIFWSVSNFLIIQL